MIHPKIESAPAPLIKILSHSNARRIQEFGGERLPHTWEDEPFVDVQKPFQSGVDCR
jgi:hypothetical protein